MSTPIQFAPSEMNKIVKRIENDFKGTGGTPAARAGANALRAMGVVYAAQTQRQFNTNSKGGGFWRPLAASTVAQRRGPAKGRRKSTRHKKRSVTGRKVSILRDTGLLFRSFGPGTHGNLLEVDLQNASVDYGVSGSVSHGGVTFGQLAQIHHLGLGHVPARPLLNDPTDSTKRRIEQIWAAAGKSIEQAEGVQ